MPTPAVELHIWKAEHTTGTKFYQVMRFVSANGHSFSIRQNGANSLFTGIGKMSTGAIALDENFTGKTNAGKQKILDKQNDGYINGKVELEESFDSISDALNWAKKNLGSKPQTLVRATLMSASWVFESPTKFAPAPQHVSPREPDEADHIKSPEWGSW